MTMDDDRRATVRRMAALLDRVPDGVWCEVTDGGLRFQAYSQERVAALRALFPGTFWRKQYDKHCNWWTYDTEFDGVHLNIYAVHEAPATCTRIEEEYEEEEDVPVQTEKRLVKKTRVRWDCSGDDSVVQP